MLLLERKVLRFLWFFPCVTFFNNGSPVDQRTCKYGCVLNTFTVRLGDRFIAKFLLGIFFTVRELRFVVDDCEFSLFGMLTEVFFFIRHT